MQTQANERDKTQDRGTNESFELLDPTLHKAIPIP